MIIGCIALGIAVLNLFFISSPGRPDRVRIAHPLKIEDSSLINTLSVLVDSPIVEGGSIEILNNGDEFFPRLYADIEGAKNSINISTYIWKEGSVSDTLLALLTTKVQQGVTVRIILDGFGAKSIGDKDLQPLVDAGGTISQFHPPRFGILTKFHKRNHSRAIVIDDTIGYTGGMSVADYWSGDAEDKDHWRDMMFRLTGPQVQHTQKVFTALWEITTGEVLVSTLSPSDDLDLRSIGMLNLTPDEDIEQLSTFLITSISAARESLFIATPYMILDPRIETALVDARARGVEVKILLPGEIIDSKLVQSASQFYYKKLLEHDVEIYEYEPTMLHSKMIVIDGVWSIIGSANIDTRSTFFNIENVIAVHDETFGKHMQDIFLKDIETSNHITLEEWRHRSIMRKILEPLTSFIDKQL